MLKALISLFLFVSVSNAADVHVSKNSTPIVAKEIQFNTTATNYVDKIQIYTSSGKIYSVAAIVCSKINNKNLFNTPEYEKEVIKTSDVVGTDRKDLRLTLYLSMGEGNENICMTANLSNIHIFDMDVDGLGTEGQARHLFTVNMLDLQMKGFLNAKMMGLFLDK